MNDTTGSAAGTAAGTATGSDPIYITKDEPKKKLK